LKRSTASGGSALSELLGRFDGLRVLVIGDSMLDQWISGRCDQISPEAPVPIVDWQSSTYGPGGAANVARNIVTLGGEAILAGVVGEDERGDRLRSVTEEAGVSTSLLLRVADRPTTSKVRVYAGQHQLLRIDQGSTDPVPDSAAADLRDRCRDLTAEVDLVVFSDYEKGVIGRQICPRAILRTSNNHPCVTVGPKPLGLHLMGGAHLASLNRLEAESVCGVSDGEQRDPAELGREIIASHGFELLAITMGGEGVLIVRRGHEPDLIPALEAKVFDACGCGDSFLAAASMALASGADQVDTVRIGNRAGASAARVVGVCGVTREEILSVGPERGESAAAGSRLGP